jgi:hypothetical protein
MSTALDHFDRLLDPIADCFTPDVAQRIAELRADAEMQARLDDLAAKANEGSLTEAERVDYLSYVEAIDMVGVLQAKARLVLKRMRGAS